jgi:hypothetical protein
MMPSTAAPAMAAITPASPRCVGRSAKAVAAAISRTEARNAGSLLAPSATANVIIDTTTRMRMPAVAAMGAKTMSATPSATSRVLAVATAAGAAE